MLTAPVVWADRWDVRREIAEGSREIRRERREAIREIARADSPWDSNPGFAIPHNELRETGSERKTLKSVDRPWRVSSPITVF
jgi:hypothetical protein